MSCVFGSAATESLMFLFKKKWRTMGEGKHRLGVEASSSGWYRPTGDRWLFALKLAIPFLVHFDSIVM